jgi:hypothetical protein
MRSYNSYAYNDLKTYFYWIVIIFVIISIIGIIYALSTPFTKKITLKDKYLRGSDRGRSVYMVVDTDNNIYQLADVWYRGEFNMANDYIGLEVGKTYNVTGYGLRIHFLSKYPYIYKYTLSN